MPSTHIPPPVPPNPQNVSEPSVFELQGKLAELQKKAKDAELSQDEIREAIGIIRTLRRTNTGPAAAKKKATAVKKGQIDLDTLLD